MATVTTPRGAVPAGPVPANGRRASRALPFPHRRPLPNTANVSRLDVTSLSKARRELGKPVSAASEAAAAAPVRPATASELPEDLRNPVVVLRVPNPTAEGGVTSVYLLGISHVAKSDCKRVRDLIKLVQPEVVMVELCKERTGLLVDPTAAGASSMWHTNTVSINGLPQGKGWPSAEQLLGTLRSQSGASVSIAQIEEDCDRLAASGLFRTAKPRISPPGPLNAPNFRPEILPSGKERIGTVSAMGSLTFEVTERILPPVTQCSVEMSEAAAEAVSQDAARGIAKGLVDACASGASTVGAALATRADLLESAREAGLGAMDVVVDGIETGKVTLKLRALPETCKAEITGLESSARDGSGWGIEPLARKSSSSSSSPKTRTAASEAGTSWKPWPVSSIRAGAASAQTANPLQEAFGSAVTRAYAALQADAGRTVGIPPGAAWRAALEQAMAEGAQQVHLGDRPTDVTRRRLVAGITDGMAANTIGAAALLAGTVAAAALGALPDSAEAPMVAAASAAAGVALWPLLGPLVEVGQFAKLSAAEIEETVRVKQPLQDSTSMLKLWGEDAIVDFPGASESIIGERDLYMAKALHAAATGQEGVSPAYVLTDTADTTYRYLMPEEGMELGCPPGSGDGTYEPLQGVGAVVGVVGTAHVHGIVQYWESSANKPQKEVLSDLL